MIHLFEDRTAPHKPAVSNTGKFVLDFLRVQGSARNLLRPRFGGEMRNLLSGMAMLEESVARIGLASDRAARSTNQDSAVVLVGHFGDDMTPIPVILAAVADGVGGAPDGDEASAIAIQIVTERIVDELQANPDSSPRELLYVTHIEDLLEEAVTLAHNAIKVQTNQGGSTLTCAFMVDGTVYMAHVGDSRAYLLPGHNKRIDLITRDHRLVEMWKDMGFLNTEQMAHHPLKANLYRMLGKIGQCEVDITRRHLPIGSLLLVTDGITDVLSEKQMLEIIARSSDPDEACDRLIRAAINHNTSDDVTAALIQIGS